MPPDRPRWPDGPDSRDLGTDRRPLHAGEHVADLEPQSGIETQRPVVVRSLQQPDAGEATLVGTLHDTLHEQTPEAAVLNRRIDGDRADACDRRALVEEVATEDLAVTLGDNRVEAGI